MQTTFRLKIDEINQDFFKTLRLLFKGKWVKVTVEEETDSNFAEVWDELEKTRKKYPPFHVSPEINLSDLANEVNL